MTWYTYNADATVATRTDAKNQQVQYSYDTYQRVTQVRRYPVAGGAEDVCQRLDLTYDTGANGVGRLASAAWGGAACTGGAWTHAYQYNSPGSITRKTQSGGGFTLEANYTFDTEGRLVSTQYPNSGPTFTYSFDSMSRPNKLTDNQGTPVDWAKDVLYNAAGQMTQMLYTQTTSGSAYYTETRQFNVLGQLTQLTIPGVVNRTYTFHATQNDGRITQMTDAISGETIDYQYDTLKRLSSAATTGPQWGQSFSYDGFGNMTARTTTPTLTMTYDVENRMVQAVHSLNCTDRYVYDPSNLRVWKQEPSRTLVYFYGVEGNLLATYGDQSNTDYNVYFGGKLIWAEASPGFAAGVAAEDRLGSIVSRNGTANRYFPYGQEPAATGEGRTKRRPVLPGLRGMRRARRSNPGVPDSQR